MANMYQGNLVAKKSQKFAIVVSRFNEFISSKLLAGAVDQLIRHGAAEESIDIAWTPGSFEIPLVAKRLAESKKYAAVICLGAVIRGGTPHFDYIAAWPPASRPSSASSPPTPSSRPSSGPEPRPATRAPTQHCRPSKWSTSSPVCKVVSDGRPGSLKC